MHSPEVTVYQAASTCGGKEDGENTVQAHLGHSPEPCALYCHKGSQQAAEVALNPERCQVMLGGRSLQKQYSIGNDNVSKLAPARRGKKLLCSTLTLAVPRRLELQT